MDQNFDSSLHLNSLFSFIQRKKPYEDTDNSG